MRSNEGFEGFVIEAEPRLRRALLGAVGVDRVEDAVAGALAYGFEHWDEVGTLHNPVGFLYRVAQSRSRPRRRPRLLRRDPSTIPDVEPGLMAALANLPLAQRTAVWLALGCGWPHQEIAEVLDVTASTVSTHVARGLRRIRAEMGVTNDAQS